MVENSSLNLNTHEGLREERRILGFSFEGDMMPDFWKGRGIYFKAAVIF